ncbi:hypothetical protein [Escherichia coli]|uniref:hypothetical protein n=1 Tax=Escherichia coli TaxID=562 RepID=UPI003570F463
MNDKNTQTTAENTITLQVGEHELAFIPTVKAYNDLQNDFMPDIRGHTRALCGNAARWFW